MSSSPRSLALAFLVNFLLPVLLVGGTAAVVYPLLNKDKNEKSVKEIPNAPPEKVRVVPVKPTTIASKVECSGVAVPVKKLSVVPQVSGKITWLDEGLAVGGKLKRGKVIARLETKDYKLQIRAQQNQIAKAKLDLALETQRGDLAARELELLQKSAGLPKGERSDLATRQHHREVAKVALDAAQSGLEQAQTQLARTVIRAPFDAVVLSEQAEVGQVVGPGSPIATIIGSEQIHIRATLPVADLSKIKFDGEPKERTQAQVSLRGGLSSGLRWPAYADRLVHELDQKTLDAQVLFTVLKPFDRESSQLPLLPGSFVKLQIEGTTPEEVYPIPRQSLVDGHYIWAIDKQGRLAKIEVQRRWSDRDTVYARAPALFPGIEVLTQAPSSPVPGAKVEVLEDDAVKPAVDHAKEAL